MSEQNPYLPDVDLPTPLSVGGLILELAVLRQELAAECAERAREQQLVGLFLDACAGPDAPYADRLGWLQALLSDEQALESLVASSDNPPSVWEAVDACCTLLDLLRAAVCAATPPAPPQTEATESHQMTLFDPSTSL